MTRCFGSSLEGIGLVSFAGLSFRGIVWSHHEEVGHIAVRAEGTNWHATATFKRDDSVGILRTN